MRFEIGDVVKWNLEEDGYFREIVPFFLGDPPTCATVVGIDNYDMLTVKIEGMEVSLPFNATRFIKDEFLTRARQAIENKGE